MSQAEDANGVDRGAEMKINTSRQNRDVHTARVDNDAVLRIIAESVAKEAGVCLDQNHVTWRAYFSKCDTSTGIRTDVAVEIIDDHAQKPTVEEMPHGGRAG